MNYSNHVPSLELCKEMKRLGICQDEPELWWIHLPASGEWVLISEEPKGKVNYIIAPTLSRMLDTLPKSGILEHNNKFLQLIIYRHTAEWVIGFSDSGIFDDLLIECFDEHLPNAVAKALIELKKREKGDGK